MSLRVDYEICVNKYLKKIVLHYIYNIIYYIGTYTDEKPLKEALKKRFIEGHEACRDWFFLFILFRLFFILCLL